MFVADDLVAWLIGLLADAGFKKLTTLVRGTGQQRALRQAAEERARHRRIRTVVTAGAYRLERRGKLPVGMSGGLAHACRYAWSSTSGRLPGSFLPAEYSRGAVPWP